MTLNVISLPNLDAVEKVARTLAPHLRLHDVVCLQGPLGAGKTTFARALLRTLGIEEDIPSPTFTLVQIYEARQFPVYHFDLYRLEDETDLIEVGWEEALNEGLVLVEWSERALAAMPRDRLVLKFESDGHGMRSVKLEPHGTWLKRVETIR